MKGASAVAVPDLREIASTARGARIPVALGVIALFATTRLLLFVAWQHPSANFVANDVYYYGYHLWRMLEQGEPGVMLEYPVPAVWFLQALYTLGGGWQTWFPWFATTMLFLDALVALSLFRLRRPSASVWWILFTGALGPIVWFRFDLLPAALVAWACLWSTSRPRVAGVLVAAGAALKLWPALLALPLAAPDPRRHGGGRQRLLAFLTAGFLFGMASLVATGWARSASPLAWQADRGLQIESVPATPLMFLRTFTTAGTWPVFLSEYNAIELQGPGVALLLHLSSGLTVAALVLAAVLSMRLLRSLRDEGPLAREALLLAVLAIVLALVVANKTLSPQYVTWLGGPLAALLLVPRSPGLQRPVRVLAVALVLVAGLTHYTYPWGTYGIMGTPNGSGWETSVLLLRNVLLVALTWYSTRLVWQVTARRPIG